jgi:O-antigen ligase
MLSMIAVYGTAVAVAMALMATAVCAPILAYSWLNRLDRLMPVVVTGLACGLLIIGGVLNARNLQYATLGAAFIESEGSIAYLWASRITSLVLLGLSVPYLIAKCLVFFRDKATIYWPVIIVVTFAITSYVLPAILGTKPGFDHRLSYPILVVLVLLVGEPRAPELVTLIKWSLVVFFLLSLAFIVIDPNRVLAPGFQGFVPGLRSRFWGLASHANAIAPMAVTCLFLELFIPSRRLLQRALVIFLSAVIIVLAQSKTAIVAVAIGAVTALYVRHAYTRRMSPGASVARPHLGQVAVFLGGLTVVLGLLLASVFGILDDLTSRLAGSKLASDAQTLTGRDVIWRVAIEEWNRSPWFGYGTSLWGLDYRLQVGLNYAFHAHNQFVQTLAEAGLVGLLGLLPLYAALIIAAIKTSASTRGASLALLLLLFLRSVTEVPLRPAGLGTGEMLLIIAMALVWRLAYLAKEDARRAIGASA